MLFPGEVTPYITRPNNLLCTLLSTVVEKIQISLFERTNIGEDIFEHLFSFRECHHPTVHHKLSGFLNILRISLILQVQFYSMLLNLSTPVGTKCILIQCHVLACAVVLIQIVISYSMFLLTIHSVQIVIAGE